MDNTIVEKRPYKKLFFLLAIAGLLVVAIIGYGVNWAFYDLNRLPKGEFLTEETSPDGNYTLKAYVTNGGATTAYSVRGELVDNEQMSKTKNVYWNNREETATITWRDPDTVIINGHTLHVPNDTYDFRTQ